MGDGKVKINVATGVTPQPGTQGAIGGLTQFSPGAGTFAAPAVSGDKASGKS